MNEKYNSNDSDYLECSGFTAKSERINALRKQYDAFLEEDQKRKKRNEYILGKLDKMRSTTALVPVRHKSDHRPSEVLDVGYHPDSLLTHNYQSSITTRNAIFPDIETNNSESYLIQEISKKYILIPKLRPSFIDNGIQPVILNQHPDRLLPVQNIPVKDVKANPDENVDWKSKYEILNLLKNDEKESIKFKTGVESELQVNKESLLNNRLEEPTNDYSNITNTRGQITPSTKFLNEFPEKDLGTNISKYDSNYNKETEENGNEILCPNNISDEKAHDNYNEAVTTSDLKENIDNKFEQLKLDYTNADETNATLTCTPITEPNNYDTQPDINVKMTVIEADIQPVEQAAETFIENAYVENGYSVENDSKMYAQHASEQQDLTDSAQTVKLEQHISPTASVDYTDIREDLNNPSHEQGAIKPEDSEIEEFTYPEVETITNVNQLDQLGVQNVDDVMYEHGEKQEPVVLEDGNAADVSGSIDDFNTEQAEMFYSEHTNENAMYPPDAKEPEHNLEFDYYQGAEKEAYPTEMNDQMEVTEKYDPNYEQQYVNADPELEPQQYEGQVYEEPHYDQQLYEQQQYEQQQYEQQPVLQEHEGYNQLQADIGLQQYEQQYDTPQEVERVLDKEDGYIMQEQQQIAGNVAQYVEGPPGSLNEIEEPVNMEHSEAGEMQSSEQVMG